MGKEVKQTDSSVNTTSLSVKEEGTLSDSLNLSNEGETTETPVHKVTEIARSAMDKDSTDLKLSEQASSSKPVPTEDEEKQKKKDEKKIKKREKRECESLEETKKSKAERKEKKAKQKDLPKILPNILTEIKMD